MKESKAWEAAGTIVGQEACDEELMVYIREGEVEALQMLIDNHWEGIVGYSMRMLGRGEEAEDVAQEVFIAVWEHRARWTPEGSVQAYLYRIARNLVLRRSRHREVRTRAEPEIRRRIPRVPTPAEDASFVECRTAFERALGALPERRREAFSLVRSQGLSLREAAEVMGVTRRTVTNHVYMAAKELEQALRAYLP